MFYSQLLLSKKGALGIVWMAAHCHKRLKKDQVQQTDISSSVDKILNDEVPVVTHRILAFLLLGVVRIYSKKVEYLYNDCHEVLNTLCGFKTGKSARGGGGVSLRRYHSITLPKRFELDAFDLELLEDQGLVGGKVRSRKKVMPAGILFFLLLLSFYEVSFGIICALYCLPDGHREAGSTSDVLYKALSLIILLFIFLIFGVMINGALSSWWQIACVMIGVLAARGEYAISEAYSTAHTPPRDVLSPHHMDQDLFVSQSSDMNITLGGPGILRRTSFSLEDRLDPMVLDEAEEEQMHNKPSNNSLMSNFQGPSNELVPDSAACLPDHRSHPVPSFEMLRGTSFSLEDRLEPMVLDEAEKDQMNDRPSDESRRTNIQGLIQDLEFDSVANPSPQGSDSVASLGITRKSGSTLEHTPNFKMLTEKGHGHDEPSDEELGGEEEHMEHTRTRLNIQEDEPRNLAGSVDKEQPVGVEKVKFLEVITPESGKWQRTEEVPLPIVTPDPKLPAAHFSTPEVANVQTPATKERKKILKKRRTLVDSNTIVPNKVFKKWLEDPSDLKRERRKVPHTCLHAWRTGKLGHCPQSFFEPLISGISIDFGSLECKTSCTTAIKPVDLSAGQDDVKSPVTHRVHEQIPDVRSPMSPEQTAIAPGTPVTHLNPLRSHEPSAVADSDIIEQTASFESVEKFPSSSDGVELDAVFREESNSLVGDSLEKDEYSSRTRMTENYLSKKFQDKKRQNEEDVLNLSQLLEGKTKKQSARLFYDILVLKSRGSVDVQQESAYDDILVQETSKLKEASQNGM
ncbi:UNVERIFIED_CONTAM: Sister chromatid cohesion 1 protein 2 [Sesamum latifolium]|uniref:Sister chromatid cohesion 1 protein 2 n=1 Tax=Sesamum latifolium TaxID=2727402 RepID=A0AAW2XF59_9LAMI